MDKKTLQKMKASLLALLATTTLSGCNQNTNQQKNDKPEETLESTQIDYIETTTKMETETTTKETLNITTESKPLTTTCQIPSMPYTWYTTSQVITPEITTSPQSETLTTSSTIQTSTDISKDTIGSETSQNILSLFINSYYHPANDKLDIINTTIDYEFRRAITSYWDFFENYCPIDKDIQQYYQELQELNKDVLKDTSILRAPVGTVIKIPVIIINDKFYGKMIASPLDQFNKRFRTPITKRYDPSTTGSIIENKYIVIGNDIQECPSLTPNTNAIVSQITDENYIKTVYYTEFFQDGSYMQYEIANNIKNIEFVEGFPIFESRSIEEAKYLGKNNEQGLVYQAYTTVAKTMNRDALKFYQDQDGKIWLSLFDCDFTKYGLEKITDKNIIERYFREEKYLKIDAMGYYYSDSPFIEEVIEEIDRHLYPNEKEKSMN